MSFETNLNDEEQEIQLSLNHESRDISSLRTLIIDNYDSYTFNLLQLCGSKKSIENVVIIRNNQFTLYILFSLLTLSDHI